jgi:hypothetical protein
MNQETLIEDLRYLRVVLSPILSDRYKKALIEAERRLTVGGYTPATNPVKLTKKRKPTKQELRDFFNSKGLK